MNKINRRILKFAIPSVAIVLSATGCSSDKESYEMANDEERIVTFHLNMPEFENSTRVSDSNNSTANLLQWSIYEVSTDEGGETSYIHLGDESSTTALMSNKASLSMTLAKGREYMVTFFAKNSANNVVTYEDGVMTIDYNHTDAISHNLNAFTGKVTLKNDGNSEVTVNLDRKLSFVGWYCRHLSGSSSTDLNGYAFSKDADAHKIKYNLKINSPVFTTYDLRTDEISGEQENLEYTERSIYNGTSLVESSGNAVSLNSTTYYLVCYNYLLTNAATAQGVIDMELEFYHPDIEDYNIKVTSNSIPVRQNYKTRIFGNFLTNGEIFGVTMQRDFDDNLTDEITPLSGTK